MEMFRATGAMFEQKHLGFINKFEPLGGSGPGGVSHRFRNGIMEHKVILNFRAVSGDKSLFRQWDPTFTTALGQVGVAHDDMVHRLLKEIELEKEMEKVVKGSKGEGGDKFDKVLGDVWNVLIVKAEM